MSTTHAYFFRRLDFQWLWERNEALSILFFRWGLVKCHRIFYLQSGHYAFWESENKVSMVCVAILFTRRSNKQFIYISYKLSESHFIVCPSVPLYTVGDFSAWDGHWQKCPLPWFSMKPLFLCNTSECIWISTCCLGFNGVLHAWGSERARAGNTFVEDVTCGNISNCTFAAIVFNYYMDC